MNIKNRVLITTSGTYPWSFVSHIFRNGYPSHGGHPKTFEVMSSDNGHNIVAKRLRETSYSMLPQTFGKPLDFPL